MYIYDDCRLLEIAPGLLEVEAVVVVGAEPGAGDCTLIIIIIDTIIISIIIISIIIIIIVIISISFSINVITIVTISVLHASPLVYWWELCW